MRRPIRDRVHRVVVAIQADVVITRQPGRAAATRSLGATGGSASIAAGRPRSGRPGDSPAPGAGGGWPAPASRCSWVLKSAGEVNTRPGRNDRSR